MKKIIVFLILAGFTSCQGDLESMPKTYSAKEGKIDMNDTEFVRLYFSPENGSINSPVKLILENQTEEDYAYGLSFSIEYFNNGKWAPIPLDLNFPDIGFLLNAGEIRESLVDLSLIEKYNKGKKGKYRYLKSSNLYVEFEIK